MSGLSDPIERRGSLRGPAKYWDLLLWISWLLFTAWEAYRKVNHFCTEPVTEYLCNSEWGLLFLGEKFPSNCTRNSTNPF